MSIINLLFEREKSIWFEYHREINVGQDTRLTDRKSYEHFVCIQPIKWSKLKGKTLQKNVEGKKPIQLFSDNGRQNLTMYKT